MAKVHFDQIKNLPQLVRDHGIVDVYNKNEINTLLANFDGGDTGSGGDIGGTSISNISSKRQSGIAPEGTTEIPISIPGYVNGDSLLFYAGGLLQTNGIDYIVNNNNIVPLGIPWPLIYDIIIMNVTTDEGSEKVTIENKFGTLVDQQNEITIDIINFNSQSDEVLFYVGGLLQTNGIDYSIDITTNKIIDSSSKWVEGLKYDIIIIKDTDNVMRKFNVHNSFTHEQNIITIPNFDGEGLVLFSIGGILQTKNTDYTINNGVISRGTGNWNYGLIYDVIVFDGITNGATGTTGDLEIIDNTDILLVGQNTIELENFDIENDGLLLFEDGELLTTSRDYSVAGSTISEENNSWHEGSRYDALVFKDSLGHIDVVQHSDYFTGNPDFTVAPVDIEDYNESLDTLLLFIDGVFQIKDIQYTVTDGQIIDINNEWADELYYTYIVIKNDINIDGFNYYDSFIENQDPIQLINYSADNDGLLFFVDGLLQSLNVDYEIVDNEIVDISGNWTNGYPYVIIILKSGTSIGGTSDTPIHGNRIIPHTIKSEAFADDVTDYVKVLIEDNTEDYVHPPTHPVSMITGALSETEIDNRIANETSKNASIRIVRHSMQSGTSEVIYNDPYIVESLCSVEIELLNPTVGLWSVSYIDGQITISSDAVETGLVLFNIIIQKTNDIVNLVLL